MIGKNQEILDTLKRLIENNPGWQATLMDDEKQCFTYVKEQAVDIVLLSSGLDSIFEQQIQDYVLAEELPTQVILHYGGGSGLLKNEIFSLYPHLIP